MRCAFLILVAATAPALADDEDAAALALADRTSSTQHQTADWRVFTEAAWSASTLQGGDSQTGERLSFDLHYDTRFATDWRAVLSDRLDTNWQGPVSQESDVNTLKEGYVSWQLRPDRIADLGRINARYGVALGYNPTDIFRADAIRSLISPDPASLRENRLGSMMLRGQTLWSGGSLTGVYSPQLADQPSTRPFSPDFGATNHQNRWLLATSQRLSEGMSPQFLISGGDGGSPSLGLNLTALINDATVAYAEWSGGRTASLLSQALMQQNKERFRSRLATGFTYTTASKLSLTLEYEFNEAGLNQADWTGLRRGSLDAYGEYRSSVTNLQDLPTQQNLFAYAAWQDAGIHHLDLTAMVRFDAIDYSKLVWLEARYHWTHIDLAVQDQINRGQPDSDFGATPERRIEQIVATYFF
jgi:hypothetical protein